MNYADDLNWLCLPGVGHDVRIEIPEAILSAEKFLLVVANPRRETECLKPFLEFQS